MDCCKHLNQNFNKEQVFGHSNFILKLVVSSFTFETVPELAILTGLVLESLDQLVLQFRSTSALGFLEVGAQFQSCSDAQDQNLGHEGFY